MNENANPNNGVSSPSQTSPPTTPGSEKKSLGIGGFNSLLDKSNRRNNSNVLFMPLQVMTQQSLPRIKQAISNMGESNPQRRRKCLLFIILSICIFGVISLGTDGWMISSNGYGTSINSGMFYSTTASSGTSNSGSLLLHPQERYKIFTPSNANWNFLKGPNGPKYTVLVTGAAGFVGMHTCLELKRLGMTPIGYDSMNNYYSTELKQSRIQELAKNSIQFVKGDVCDRELLQSTIIQHRVTRIIHLAAQAGVRYSLGHPLEYTKNNIDCTVHLLETYVSTPGLQSNGPLVYASSSSVYGNNKKVPFQEMDRVEDPASLYAVTKRSNELLAQTYWNLYNVSSIGLRFFTVYGPYGRPDMAPWLFTDKITNGQTIKVFNHGLSKRDFTYIDDIVQGVVNALYPKLDSAELVNLGNGRPIVLADFVQIVEKSLGKVAKKNSVGMQKGDVPVTYADITKARHMLGYRPSTSIEDGIPKFVKWFQEHNATQYRMNN